MENRVSKYPGRTLITPEDGSAPFYATLERADEPTQPGDPLNKNTFLKDDTAALFGLDKTAVPDDVLRKIDSDFSRIACGTVTGNSSAGEDEPNSITLPFVPKMVYVTRENRSPWDTAGFVKFDSFLWVEGVTQDAISNGGKYRCYKLDGNTFSWWVNDTNYGAAVTGRYIAFG